MATPSLYRALPPEQRLALVTHVMRSSRELRALYVQRLADLPGGFRAVTLRTWSVERLAQEVVRRRAETAQDEMDLLRALYLEVEPEIQMTFLDAAGVPHDRGNIDDALETPYTDEAAVQRAAGVVRERHGARGDHYLRTIARYNGEGWPGIEALVATLPG